MDSPLSEVFRKLAPGADKGLYLRLAEKLVPVHRPKGTLLVRQGSMAPRCWFVIQGCLRLFSVDDLGRENTTAFYTEGDSVTILPSFRDGSDSPYSLECLEDALLWEGDEESQESMVREFPTLQGILLRVMEGELDKSLAFQARFRSLTPQERYEDFLATRPGLAARVPQHYLASYLGMQPESLSRIKKRLYLSRKA